MSEPRFDPFHPPVELTDLEWRMLEAIRIERAVDGAAARVGLSEAQFRQALRFLAEKLHAAAVL